WAGEGEKLSKMLEIGLSTPEGADRSGSMVVYGTPDENPLVAELLAHHRIAFRDDGLAVGTTALKIDAPALIAALPSPWAPGEVVVVYTARDPEAAHQLNAVFHGPAQITVATRAGGGRDVVGQLWPVLDDEGRVERVDAAPGTLTSAELEEDLLTLDQLLRDHYSGWADADLRQRAEGGWAARTESTLGRIRERASWTYTDAAKLLVFDYLAPIRDTHFTVSGLGVEEGVPTRVDARLVVPVVPYVTDLRLVEREGRVEVAAGPDALLGQAVDLPMVPDPRAVAPDTPYRLPTVLADGTGAWLVGVFVEGRSAPESLALLGTELALHRPGSRRTERAKGGWDLSADGPLPVLAVHTMNKARLDGLTATASELREEDVVVLDLRANGGGSDRPAADWVGALSPGRYQAAGGSDVDHGRWQAEAPFAYRSEGAPWTGERLWVLVDRGVASSGETFTFLASQVPNARVVGESTSGCSENGNVTERGPLPHTGLVLHFGRTRFAWEDVRPIAEGVGIFPDLWLDEADPVAFLAQLP
ncbi:MAG: hypothetical protein KC621_14200, partial [Myxococcales bacterium]|nr:hypothetical protein [Myxococcales bacterium]